MIGRVRFFVSVCLVLGGIIFVSVPGLCDEMAGPTSFTVTNDGSTFRGRWDPVKGASYYEVWTQQFGGWRHDEKDFAQSPFTSSFELPGDDDRTKFRVRAVFPDQSKGEFSDTATAQPVASEASGPASTTKTGRAPSGSSDFDPEAPPPEPPSSLFAVWNDPREIRLVWQASKGAVRYSVEEMVDDTWVSVQGIEFPKDTSATIKDRPMPGPYQFRIRAVGRNGRASEPSRATSAKR